MGLPTDLIEDVAASISNLNNGDALNRKLFLAQ